MGWRGVVRSMEASARAAERNAKKRQRELEQRQKQNKKMQELEQAAYEVELYENHIDILKSLHVECGTPIDWTQIAVLKEPEKPQKMNQNETKARLEADRYKPGFIDRIFKREAKKRSDFNVKIGIAIEKDATEHLSKLSKWEQDVTDWKENVRIAHSLLSGDTKAKIEALDSLAPFSEISNLGSIITFSIEEDGLVQATVNIHGKEIVPNEMKSLLQSGKLSVKQMPKGMFNEIFQDYVCSCVLRVANEFFSVIPDDMVIVTAVDELLNTKTGHLEELPILSAFISRHTLHALNLETIDPSDSMNNFIHNMSFKKTQGFEAVSRVEANMLVNR